MATKTKNIRLLIALVVLMGITGWVMSWNPNGDRLDVDRELFAVRDTTRLDEVQISRDDTVHTLQRVANGWQLNGKYPADPSVIQVLMSVLSDVRVFRPAAAAQTDSLRDKLKSDGIRVTLLDDTEVLGDFWVGGTERTSTSYFMPVGGEQPYLVHLPGHRSFVAGLFQMPANDWRKRGIISVPYNVMASVELDYNSENLEDVAIRYGQQFFYVEGLDQVDTTAMMTYVDQFGYFQTDYFIEPGDFPRFDSLMQTAPVASVTVTPLDALKAEKLDLWPLLPGDQYRLGRISNGQLLLLEDRRIRWIFRQPQDFAPRSRR